MVERCAFRRQIPYQLIKELRERGVDWNRCSVPDSIPYGGRTLPSSSGGCRQRDCRTVPCMEIKNLLRQFGTLILLLLFYRPAFGANETQQYRCFVYNYGPAHQQFLIAKGASFIWSQAIPQAYGNLSDAIAALKILQQQGYCKLADDANPFDCTISHRADGRSILRAKPTDGSWLSEYLIYSEDQSINQIDEWAAHLRDAGQCRRIQDLGVEQMKGPGPTFPKQC
jgi:hypothetical protein